MRRKIDGKMRKRPFVMHGANNAKEVVVNYCLRGFATLWNVNRGGLYKGGYIMVHYLGYCESFFKYMESKWPNLNLTTEYMMARTSNNRIYDGTYI